jgi:uncharacterized protein (DUF1330 family)
MSAYVIFVRDRITDPAEFSQYEQSAGAAAAGHPLTPLAFYGALDTLEGPPVDGAVVLERGPGMRARFISRRFPTA